MKCPFCKEEMDPYAPYAPGEFAKCLRHSDVMVLLSEIKQGKHIFLCKNGKEIQLTTDGLVILAEYNCCRYDDKSQFFCFKNYDYSGPSVKKTTINANITLIPEEFDSMWKRLKKLVIFS